MSIIKIGKLINPIEFEDYLNAADLLPVIVHKYGTTIDIPDYPCWMKYTGELNVVGSISFSRHTFKHPLLKEMVDKVVDILTPIFTYKPQPERIHILKTEGSIVRHRDESGRMSCINIGIKNSSIAITKISTDGNPSTFEQNHTQHIIEEGYGYLLNTNQYHAVSCEVSTPRYLLTYGFGETYDKIKDKFKL